MTIVGAEPVVMRVDVRLGASPEIVGYGLVRDLRRWRGSRQIQ